MATLADARLAWLFPPILAADLPSLSIRPDFLTPDEAGVAGACAYNEISKAENKEYGGFVYQKANGRFTYTDAYPGDFEGSGPGQSMTNFSKEVPVAWFHTHGAYMEKFGANNFLFSKEDRGLSDATGKANYMADPSDNVHRYDPKSGNAKGKGMGNCKKPK